ncbi:hypothetical protein ACFPYI_04925 [Halomarina salina]|uniref:DUF7123 domain-containing protein n=1 Tax=Halomarina salina TaxID=1872699 RepID=A0ABD5RJN5_9EURY|nr:hypothetical protein [Halomarina salina]
MSASAEPTTTMSEKQRRIASFLEENATTQTYFKSRLIGDELGMSAKEVGANMRAVREASALSIEKWGYSSGTTWKVTA